MKHITSKIITSIAIYIVVIIGIFIIQFKSGKTFSLNIGDMSISGRNDTVDGKTVPLLPIQIVSNGISFFVSERDAIIATTDTDARELNIVNYKNTDKTFRIECSEDVSITFTSDKLGDIEILTISSEMPESITSVSIPWKIVPNARFEIKNRKSLVSMAKKTFQFNGNYGFTDIGIIDSSIEQPRLILEPDTAATYSRYIESKAFRLESLASMGGSTEEEYKAAKEAFANLALSTMRTQISKKNRNEQLFVSYIAEMARRNMYTTALNNVPAALLTRQQRTPLSLSFYGNTIELQNDIFQAENIKSQKLSKLVSEKTLAVFEFFDLIPFLMNHSGKVMINDLKVIIDENDLSKLTVKQAIGMLQCSIDYAEYFPGNENFFEKNLDTCFRKITDSFIVIENELYPTIQTDTETYIDTLLALELSNTLLRFSDNRWYPLGYKLFKSVCSLVAANGSLAARYTVSMQNDVVGLVVNDELVYSVEQIYPYMIRNNWYPHAFSLHSAKSGLWIYTSAKNITAVTTAPGTIKLTVEGVKDGTEYLIVRNIPKLTGIIIYGLNYRSDQRFETYNTSGYVYNANTSTLYLKLKHKQDTEQIILHLGE